MYRYYLLIAYCGNVAQFVQSCVIWSVDFYFFGGGSVLLVSGITNNKGNYVIYDTVDNLLNYFQLY